MRSFLPLLLLALLSSGCSSQKEGLNAAETSAGIAAETPPSSPFTIVALHVESDSLIAELRYGGGFRDHDFALISDGVATKSLPRQQPLRITHNANGDMGKALITSRQAFDLRRFRDPAQPVVRIAVDGWPERLDYTYSP
ncbi:MAG: hypothetical protein L7S67_05745 [Flavobacteriales bacterium]|nr:hypothetical protein [Flavobacteriales bacterium]